jgi:hypothetical protein
LPSMTIAMWRGRGTVEVSTLCTGETGCGWVRWVSTGCFRRALRFLVRVVIAAMCVRRAVISCWTHYGPGPHPLPSPGGRGGVIVALRATALFY